MKAHILFCLIVGLMAITVYEADAKSRVPICMLPLEDVVVNGTTAKEGNIICDKIFVQTVWEIYKGADHQVAKKMIEERIASGELSADGNRIQRDYLGGGYYTATNTDITEEVYNILPLGIDENGEMTMVEIHIPIAETQTKPNSHCFHGDVVVFVDSEGGVIEKKLSELSTGEFIWTPYEFVRVDGWLHKDPDMYAEFIKIITESGSLTLTSEHYIEVYPDCDSMQQLMFMKAGEITLDECLVDDKFMAQKIREITIVYEKGVYAPFVNSDRFYAKDLGSNKFFRVTPYAKEFPSDNEQWALFSIMVAYEYCNDPDDIQGLNPWVETFVDLREKIIH